MNIIQNEPSRIQLVNTEGLEEKLRRLLTYEDKKQNFAIAKHRRADWYKAKYGEEAHKEKLEELKAQRLVCLWDEKTGTTYSGLSKFLSTEFGVTPVNNVVYPKLQAIPWAKAPPFKLYPYQEKAIEKLLEVRHGAVAIGTGLGKSYIALHLVKELGLQTIIMAPYSNIAEQLYDEFAKHFGVKYVGAYFDGKKQFKKKIVIATGAGLTRLDPDSEAYQALSTAQVFIADESHFTPAATFKKVCLGVAANAPYRFFLSATQLRNDGADLLLEGIIGPIVHEMTVREGVDQGFLAKPIFRMIEVDSPSLFESRYDALKMERVHLLHNPNVNRTAADIANRSVSLLGHPVLILVEEMEQFADLLPLLRHKVAFAHGGVTEENRGKIPELYHKSDPQELVQAFNNGEIPILVGTSCVSTGTNFKAVKTLIYLQGGKSEVQVRQAIGRSTRLHGDKTVCAIYDFDVGNIQLTHRHAMERLGFYEEIYGPVQQIRYGVTQ